MSKAKSSKATTVALPELGEVSSAEGMSRDEIRAALIAKIRKAWPRKLPESIERDIELANIATLRRHLAAAEVLPEIEPVEPVEYVEPSPLTPERDRELIRRVLSTRTGVMRPPHTYVLARDECKSYDGPAWVPFNLWSVYWFEGDGPLAQECARKLIKHPDAENLWSAIAQLYKRPDSIAANLPIICANAIADWRARPHDTPSEHKAKREDLGRKAKQLAIELERFFLSRDPDENDLPGLLEFTQLMSAEERERLDVTIRRMTGTIVNRARKEAGVRMLDWDEYNDDDSGRVYSPARRDAHLIYELMLRDHSVPYDYPYGGVPTLPDMLRRIGDKFTVDADDPPDKRPNSANAERNLFAHALCKYFWTSYAEVSPKMAASIVSIFFDQGIDENEISQMLRKVRAANPVSADPAGSETSPWK